MTRKEASEYLVQLRTTHDSNTPVYTALGIAIHETAGQGHNRAVPNAVKVIYPTLKDNEFKITCSLCGTLVKPRDMFCRHCGAGFAIPDWD